MQPLTGSHACLGLISGSDLRELHVTGAGQNSYQTLALDGDGTLTLYEEHGPDPANCNFTNYALGADPVAMDTLGRIEFQRAYVANRAADSISVVRDDGSTGTIPLAGFGGNCVDCPVDVKFQATAATSCTVEQLLLDESGASTWSTAGCAPDEQGPAWTTWRQAGTGGVGDSDWSEWTSRANGPMPLPPDAPTRIVVGMSERP